MWWFLLILYSLTKLYIQWELPCDPLWAATSYPVGRPWSKFDMCSQKTAYTCPIITNILKLLSSVFNSVLNSNRWKRRSHMHLRKLKIMTAGASLFNIVAHCQISFFWRMWNTFLFKVKKNQCIWSLFFFFYNSPGRFPSVISLYWQSTIVRYCTLSHIVVLDLYTMLLICHWYGVVLNLKSQLFLVIPHYML